jgi:adenosine deaminase
MTASSSAATAEQLRALPKVELHVHLEGTFDAPQIAAMADAVGETLPRPVDSLFAFEDLTSFLRFLDWTCGLVRTPEQASAAAYDFARRASGDGTVYAEVIVNPTHWAGWALDDLFGALADGFSRAEADGLTDCRLLPSILREQSGEEALALVSWMGDRRPDRIVGLSVDGNETAAGRTGQRFAPAYARAGELGFGRTAHTGESGGPDGVRDALDLLDVDRIDHGVRAVEDPDLVRRLADEGVTLNVCLSSNLVTLYASLADHPIPRLMAAGVPVTVNTDDPGYLGCSLVGEFAAASDLLGWSLADAAAATRRAIDAAFCGPEKAAALHARVDAFLAASAPAPA